MTCGVSVRVARDFTCYIENMTDQSHVAWAHHGAAGNRRALNLPLS